MYRVSCKSCLTNATDIWQEFDFPKGRVHSYEAYNHVELSAVLVASLTGFTASCCLFFIQKFVVFGAFVR